LLTHYPAQLIQRSSQSVLCYCQLSLNQSVVC
jgi:hypothetical protein